MTRQELLQVAKERAAARMKRNSELSHLPLRQDPKAIFATLYHRIDAGEPSEPDEPAADPAEQNAATTTPAT